jgi:hypothetical protein
VRRALWLAACLALASFLGFRALGARPIFSPAEARYSMIAREMVESGDWVQPRLNGVRYDEKPPLLYWTIAASYGLFGETDFASRAPSAAAYVATAGLTFLIAEELIGLGGAPLAALIYMTAVGPFLFGRFVFTDTLLIFCTTLSLYGLVRMVVRPAGPVPALTFYAGMALAGLTKGLIGIVFPAATAATFWIVLGPRRFGRRLRPFAGPLILAALFVPWHVLMQLRDPSFLQFYFVNEHLLRFLNDREPIDYVSMPIGAFWAATLVWLFPWSLFLPGALRSAWRDNRRALAVPMLWSAWVIGFFTLTPARLEYYAMPAFPALAVILAAGWQRFFARGARHWHVQVPALLLFSVGLGCSPALFVFPDSAAAGLTALVSSVDGYYREYFLLHPGASFAMVNEALRLARPFVVLLILMGSGVGLLVSLRRRRLAFALLVAGFVPMLAIVDLGHRMVAADRSQIELAETVRRYWIPGAELVTAGAYEDFCGITYYTRLPTRMVDGAGADLLFGFRHGDAPERFWSGDELRRRWQSEQRIFLVSDKSFEIPGGVVLAEGARDVLRTNHPPPGVDIGPPER